MLNLARKLTPGWDEAKASTVFRLFPLDMNKKISTLSYGEKTQLYVIITFSRNADLYVLDEPTRGLDPIMQDRILGLIKEKSMQGSTVLFSSHRLEEIEATADTMAIINKGRLVMWGNLDDIKEDYFQVLLEPKYLESFYSTYIPVINRRDLPDKIILLCHGGLQAKQNIEKHIPSAYITNTNLKEIFLNLLEEGGDCQ